MTVPEEWVNTGGDELYEEWGHPGAREATEIILNAVWERHIAPDIVGTLDDETIVLLRLHKGNGD